MCKLFKVLDVVFVVVCFNWIGRVFIKVKIFNVISFWISNIFNNGDVLLEYRIKYIGVILNVDKWV